MERLEQLATIRMMKKSFIVLIVFALIGATLVHLVEGRLGHKNSVGPQVGQEVAGSGHEGSCAPLAIKRQDDKEQYVRNFESSIWWSLTTLTTGGFADLYPPKTFPGWVLTIFLVISGVVVVGIFTASLTSIFLGQDANEMKRTQANIKMQLEDIDKKLASIESRNPLSK
jgi:hypothetical protein